jgi:diguanylate cyclase (GGDEF)-like protein/PAS domain S-box-containing protein
MRKIDKVTQPEGSELSLINTFYYVSLPVLMLFSYLNYKNGLGLFALLDGLIICLLTASMFMFRNKKGSRAEKFIILLSLLMLHIMALFHGGFANSSLFWFFIFPLIALYLCHKRAAFVWIFMLVISIALMIVFVNLSLVSVPYSIDILYVLVMALLVETFIFNYTLGITLQYKDRLERFNRELLNTNLLIDKYFMLIKTDLEGNIIHANDTFLKLTAYKQDQLSGVSYCSLCTNNTADNLALECFSSMDKQGEYDGVLECKKSDGSSYWADTHVVVEYDNNVKTGYLIFQQDVTQKVALEKASITDTLTQVNNRMRFDEISQQRLEEFSRYENISSLIICDIDDFKLINDKYGHSKGDEVLKAFAKVLKHNVRFTDTLARWGGEEFVVLLPQADITHAVAAAEKMRSAIQKYDFGCDERITASFGVAMTQNDDTQTRWFNRADRALYLAKQSGKNSVNYL